MGVDFLGGVEGFFQGREIRNKWQDRKLNRKLAENQETRTQESHGLNMTVTRDGNTRANEAHGVNLTVATDGNSRANATHGLNMRTGTSAEDQREIDRARTNRANSRADAVADEERALLAETFPDQGAAPTAAPTAPAMPAAAPQAPTTVAAPPAARTPRSLPQPGTEAPATPLPAVASPQQVQATPSATISTKTSRADIAVGAGAPSAMVQSAKLADDGEAQIAAGVDGAGVPLTPEAMAELQVQIDEVDATLAENVPAYNPAPREAPAAPAPAPRQLPTPAELLPPSADARSIPQAAADTVAPVPVKSGMAPIETLTPQGQPLSPQDQEIRAAQQAAIPASADPRSIPGQALTTVTEGQAPVQPAAPTGDAAPAIAAQPTGAPVSGALTPTLQAPAAPGTTPAVDTLPVAEQPKAPGTAAPMSPAQKTAAKRDLQGYVTGEAADRLKQFYMRNGMPEKAQAYEAFFEQEQTKDAVESWSDAVLAAQLGDDAAFEENIAKVYNRNYADGYEIINDGKAFIRDDAGNIVGAEVEFRNLETGETFTRTFEGSTDLYSQAINALAPAAIFEYQWAEFEGAKQRTQALQQAAQDMQIAKDQPDPTAFTDRVLKIAGELADMDLTPASPDVYIERAMGMIAAEQAAAGAQGAGAGVPRWTGQ